MSERPRHPSPYAYRDRPVPDDPEVVGWFQVAFRDDPDHEYPFTLYRDGRVLPELDLVEVTPRDVTMFARYLADPDFHHVRFTPQGLATPRELDEMMGRPPL